MSKQKDHQKKILKALEKDEMTATELTEKTGIPYINVCSALKNLRMPTTGQYPKVEKEGEVFRLIDKSKRKQTGKVTSPGTRNTSKYKFKGKAYSKSGLVFKIVSDYVIHKQPTLKELKEVFPDEIVSRFGVINTLKEAKKLSSDRPRYYMKEENHLRTVDKKLIVVTNQWTLSRFVQFLSIARKLGYEIEQGE